MMRDHVTQIARRMNITAQKIMSPNSSEVHVAGMVMSDQELIKLGGE
jgi:hypothetical protein